MNKLRPCPAAGYPHLQERLAREDLSVFQPLIGRFQSEVTVAADIASCWPPFETTDPNSFLAMILFTDIATRAEVFYKS